MTDTYCGYCGDLSGFFTKRCKECHREICTSCLVTFREFKKFGGFDEENEWELKGTYCGQCAINILERRNNLFKTDIFCLKCGNKSRAGLGNFCPKCGAKLSKGIPKTRFSKNKK